MTLPSYDEIMNGRKARGAFSRAECAAWGISFPPPPGFLNRLFPQTRDDAMLIPCTRGMVAIVDFADYEHIADFYWAATKGSRPGRRDYFQPHRNIRHADGRRGALSMAREILKPDNGLEVDHINGDTFDNRRANLRICTHAENVSNRAVFCNNSSGYKGVRKFSRSFGFTIQLNGERFVCKGFKTAEEAARAYDQRAMDLHGSFASLNFPAEAA